MNNITLRRNEKYFLDEHFLMIKKGKIVTRGILETGKVIANENCLEEGEIIGNFFNFLVEKSEMIPKIGIEIEALEDNCVLEQFNLPNKIFEDFYFQKLLFQLIKKSIIMFLYHLYGKKGYILATMKLYVNEEGYIPKKNIKPENFNISRSQFYLLCGKLKEEKFFYEKNNKIYMNMQKIDKYLEQFLKD